MKKTLIVPLVTNGNSKVFEYNQFDCIINCVDAVSSLEISKFDEIYFILNKQVAQPWRLEEKISADVTRLNHIHFSFIMLPSMTDSPAETIYKALSVIGWDDRCIFIKDGDNKFALDSTPTSKNYIITSSLENLDRVDPKHKSYVKTDEQGFVTNCIEKRVISDKFIAGGYCFRTAHMFKEAYEALKNYNSTFYISDIIYWLILNKDEKFLPIEAKDFLDFNI